MIKFGVQPVVSAVATIAGGGKLGGDVIGIGGRLKILDVARIALRRKRLELGTRTALVARLAIQGGMGSCQREAIVVTLNLLNRNLPAANGVALFAIRAQLPAVNIRVAILAAQADVAEHRFHVALRASDRRMHAAQRVPRLVVIKFGNRADRLPGIRRMTVLAGEVEVTVWTMSALAVNLRPGRCRTYGKSH